MQTPFQFKVKGYMNEAGEYTEFFPAEAGTILQFILQHWFNESLPNNLDVVAIKNNDGDFLVIDHVKRDIFDYYYIPAQSKKDYHHVKTDIQLMFFVLESFFNHRKADLEAHLKKQNDLASLVRGGLLGKNFEYQITRRSLWKTLHASVYAALLMLVLLIGSFFVHLVVVALVVLFMGLALATHWQRLNMYRQYYRDNKPWKVTISRGAENIRVESAAWKRDIPKTDIRKLTRFVPPPDDAHAQAEYYLEVEFLNGNILNLTSLLMSQVDADGKFMHNLIPFEVEVSKHGFLRKETNLQDYFSAIGDR